MPEEGRYLLSHVGFSTTGEPFIMLEKSSSHHSFNPFGHTLTLSFDTENRFCTGWYDLLSRTHSPCPENATIDSAYTQCPACQKRTGFNPAFYNAASISPQQEIRNSEPHILYLAHFGKGVIKVGISHAARNIARLLEQGARSALILETFPSAIIARQYEAKIAALPGILETIQHRKKQDLLRQPYDAVSAKNELHHTLSMLQDTLGVTFNTSSYHTFDEYYFFSSPPPVLSTFYDSSSHSIISGTVTGMIGTTIFTRHDDTALGLPIKKFIGHFVTISYHEKPISLPAQQMTLF